MACLAQSMLSASGGIFLRSKPQAAAASHVRGSIIGGGCSSRPFLLTCNASSPPAPTQEDPDCNEEECAPEKEVGSLSAEWLAEDRTKVVGTFPPKKRKWGYVEKDTAGQTNIYSVEPMVYISESAISSGTAGTSADGAENTAAIAGGARPHHRRRGLVHPHPGEQEPAAGAGSPLQRPAAQLLRRQVPAGGGADPRGPSPRRGRRGGSTRGDVHRRGICGSGGTAAIVVS